MNWTYPKYEAEPTSSISSVVVDDTRIYFYSDITTDKALELTRYLRQLDDRLQNESRVRRSQAAPIWLHINSQGGTALDGLAVTDLVLSLDTPVYTVVEGLAASAATFVSLAGCKRYARPNSLLSIHELSSGFWGKHSEMKTQIHMQEMLTEQVLDYYASRTKLSRSELDEKLKQEFWMNAKQAVEYGFVDEILE